MLILSKNNQKKGDVKFQKIKVLLDTSINLCKVTVLLIQ